MEREWTELPSSKLNAVSLRQVLGDNESRPYSPEVMGNRTPRGSYLNMKQHVLIESGENVSFMSLKEN